MCFSDGMFIFGVSVYVFPKRLYIYVYAYACVLAFLIEQRLFLSLFFFFNLGSLEICAATYILQLQKHTIVCKNFSTEMAISDNKAQTTFTVEVYQLKQTFLHN